MGDMGGFGEALFYIGTFLMFFFNYGQFDQVMVTSLYRAKNLLASGH